jgi:hypothetical protein
MNNVPITTVPYKINGFHATVNVSFIPNLYEFGYNYSTFEWNCKDIYGMELSRTVSEQINIVHVNHPPVSLYSIVNTTENNEVLFNLTAFDVDGDPLHFSIISLPENGTLYRLDPSSQRGSKIIGPTKLNVSEVSLYYVPKMYLYGSDLLNFTVEAQSGFLNFRGSKALTNFNIFFVNQRPFVDIQYA